MQDLREQCFAAIIELVLQESPLTREAVPGLLRRFLVRNETWGFFKAEAADAGVMTVFEENLKEELQRSNFDRKVVLPPSLVLSYKKSTQSQV